MQREKQIAYKDLILCRQILLSFSSYKVIVKRLGTWVFVYLSMKHTKAECSTLLSGMLHDTSILDRSLAKADCDAPDVVICNICCFLRPSLLFIISTWWCFLLEVCCTIIDRCWLWQLVEHNLQNKLWVLQLKFHTSAPPNSLIRTPGSTTFGILIKLLNGIDWFVTRFVFYPAFSFSYKKVAKLAKKLRKWAKKAKKRPKMQFMHINLNNAKICEYRSNMHKTPICMFSPSLIMRWQFRIYGCHEDPVSLEV